MKKAIFFDIDGTLYKRGHDILPSTIKAIQQLRANGHLVFVCTGRSRALISDCPILEIGFDGIIGGCGSYGEYQGKIIFNKEIPQELLLQTIEKFKNYKGSYILEGKEYLYYCESPQVTHEIFSVVKKELGIKFRPVEEYLDQLEVNKFMYLSTEEEAKVVFKDLSKEYKVLQHEPLICECTLPEISKGNGIIEMCKHLGVEIEDTYGFGDSINDVDMLKTCKVGISMGNVSEVAKEVADYITDDILKDGIYNACKHFELI